MPPWPPAKPGLDAGKWSCKDPRRLEPATWFPARPRAGARLSLKESRRKEHQGGERFSPPWTHLSLVCDQREVFSMFRDWPAALHPTPVTARPPAGRAEKGGFADGRGPSHPQGEASGLWSPTRKSVPNQGTYMGTVLAPPPFRCASNAKTSEWERAGPKKGGAGGIPPRLFASGLSLEKAWIPRPGPGGGSTWQGLPCGGPNGTPCRSPAGQRKGHRPHRNAGDVLQRDNLPETDVVPAHGFPVPVPDGGAVAHGLCRGAVF